MNDIAAVCAVLSAATVMVCCLIILKNAVKPKQALPEGGLIITTLIKIATAQGIFYVNVDKISNVQDTGSKIVVSTDDGKSFEGLEGQEIMFGDSGIAIVASLVPRQRDKQIRRDVAAATDCAPQAPALVAPDHVAGRPDPAPVQEPDSHQPGVEVVGAPDDVDSDGE
jgi:hypothetical protein